LALKLVIADLTPNFPDFRVALVVAEGLTIAPDRSATLKSEIADAEARRREPWSRVELSAIPGVAAWRRGLSVRSGSRRPATDRPSSG
jgi:hypothetical protein